MQVAPDPQAVLFEEVQRKCEDLAHATRHSNTKCTRDEIDDLLLSTWSNVRGVIIYLGSEEFQYNASIRSPEYQSLRQSVWGMFLQCCGSREQLTLPILFPDLMQRIESQLDDMERSTIASHTYELQQFWSRLCELANNVTLDGKSDHVAVNTVLRDINTRHRTTLPVRYRPSGRLGLLEATLKVMFHYAATSPYQTREVNQDGSGKKYRSLVIALCTADQVMIRPLPIDATNDLSATIFDASGAPFF